MPKVTELKFRVYFIFMIKEKYVMLLKLPYF